MTQAAERRTWRVGIITKDFDCLAGAIDFLVSVVDALFRTANGRQIIVIVEKPLLRRSVRWWMSAAVRIVKDVARRRRPLLPGRTDKPADVIKRLEKAGLPGLPVVTVAPGLFALEKLCFRENIDVLIPLAAALVNFRVPWVGYIYDFQHRYLPELFSAEARKFRDQQFDDMLQEARVVIVNSRAVKLDAKRFHSKGATVVPLPFSSAASPSWFDADPVEVRRRYGIAERYFMVSNQFWVHKRHGVAIKAFLALAERHPDVELVCTGSTEDWRAPLYFTGLQGMIAASAARERVHILGLIPKLDQVALLRGCEALVQPTAFEGGPGGGSVFDAVALGVRSIVSDIPVNREIEDHVTTFFPLDDVVALTEAMEAIMAAPAFVTSSREFLTRAGGDRRKALGTMLWKVVDHALDRRNPIS